ncbi:MULTISPECIES: hypothetical protein [unclassified Amycolatopsis]|uniref:hypothetical protein n=1 Tax=unclassified Amycolatopsis TaxID=2618356 RepID=UPI001C6A05BA|nr:hypothetical protein [Amycolatopsis sp. DSM 110486]QYN22939.1 hypothetical protein K1T34_11005 [Amycolatopsis sp. DSM 110486]
MNVVDSGQQVQPCRRQECSEDSLWRGLCAAHWSRWQRGLDALELAEDDVPPPPAQVWWPPERQAVPLSSRVLPGS